RVKALVLQGPELLRQPDAVAAVGKVPFVAVMATHEEAALDRAHLVLPAAGWAGGGGTVTNFQRRVPRVPPGLPPPGGAPPFPAPGGAAPRWELAAGALRRLGVAFPAASARDVFALLAGEVPGYAGLDYRAVGSSGRVLAPPPEAAPTREAHA